MSVSTRTVSLYLNSGESFEGIPLTNFELTLGEFLDVTLKNLEGACKLTLPETDEDLIDSRDFHVFSHDKSEEFSLTSQLKHIPYLTFNNNEYPPTLILESSIFRSAVEVDIDDRVGRRRGTEITKNHPPHLSARSLSLSNKGMSSDHMIFLAGRKEYDNHSKRLHSSSDLTTLPEGSLLQESFERALSTSMSMSIDDVNSVHSFGSEASDLSYSETKTVQQAFSNLHTGFNNSDMQEERKTTGNVKADGKGEPPKLLLKQDTLDDSLEEITLTTPTSKGSFSALLESHSSDSTTKSVSSHTSTRKVKLASRRSSHNPSTSEETGDDNLGIPSSPFSGSFSRTGLRSKRLGSVVISPQHAKVYGSIKMFVVDFDIPDANVEVCLEIRGDNTVAQIKQFLWKNLRDEGHIVQEFDFLWDPGKFTLTYEMNYNIYELYDEQQILYSTFSPKLMLYFKLWTNMNSLAKGQTSTVAQLWRQERRLKGLLIVETKRMESKEEKTLNMSISSMIGIGLYQLQFANNDELDITRRKMVAERRKAVQLRDPAMYSMEVEVHFSSLPPHLGEDNKLLIRVHYEAGSYQTFQVDMHTTADEFLPTVFPVEPNKRKRLGLPENCIIDQYVLKVAGRNSYIHGNFELIEFSQIVKALSKHRDIDLSLVKRLDVTLDQPEPIADWNLIDESTGLTGTHEELSALTKEHTQIFTMSLWDLQQKFRVRILGLDNLHDCSPEFDVVYVDVAVFHGGEELCTALSTQEISFCKYPRWNQWLVFSILVKNLPKASRLCFAVSGGVRRNDSKKRSGTWTKKDFIRQSTLKSDGGIQSDRPLHWVNMQILDHRALLRQGVLRLNLWPYDEAGDEGRWGGMSPVGSTAINPDGNTAAVLFIELDTYMHPVACPTEGFTNHFHKENSPFKSHLDKLLSSDPLESLDKVQKELLWKCRSQLTTIPEALPKFLKCVDWADLDQVTETHRLLANWAPITMDVALELLDYHFADEKVRTKAVDRLSKLTNDEVLVFLLQLIQVLKFEPYHDSSLARFLLKRALQSKRIGHFFFWYLRSEMDSPQFSQRFGILLESYLKGCGKALFKELQQQHRAVHDIMSVASGLKKYIEKHKGSVTDYAKDELRQHHFPELFAPPFDPGLTMGNLQIDKCRVMDSKKSPLLLEFLNLDPSAVTQKPIKIIAKHGDDLRQDMLTLQMLTLMDSLWQSHGLDLFIIPYGCIATGNEMGMIEVVQDAETVAKIQLHHGGSFSTLRDEPLYEWLKKKNPNPKHFEKAIDRFMYSCAGYCVATYVLGIGDRHNDNIMLTVTGNLFHIDFGHFLGNTKAFLGVNRERAPFVLTPDFEYVLGKRTSETFKKFEDTAVKAYLIIRQNANLFINLFSMMKCTGIPELRSVEDLEYLKSVLVLNKSDDQAAEHFRQQIQRCLRLQWSTQLSWLAHNWVHR